MSIYGIYSGQTSALTNLNTTDFYATNQTISSASQTLISGASGTLSANYNNFTNDYSSGVYTCLVPGVYITGVSLSWGSSLGSGYGYVRIDKYDYNLETTTTICGDEQNYAVLTTDAPYLNCSTPCFLRRGDTLSFYVYQSSGSSQTPNFMHVACARLA